VVNLGNPDTLKWTIENVDRVLRQQGIDYYRHDFNIEPLIFWRNNDAADRQGITEIKYVTGFLAFYDELLRRHPGMLIDNCASGGRRNDVETLRRSVPLLRSDTWGEPVGQQCQTYGLANWVPFWGTGIVYSEPKDLAYVFRSQMGPSYTSCWDVTPKGNYDLHRKLLAQWRSVRAHILYGDYYPLTPYSAANDVWMAWQFDRPEKGEGVVQAFRRGGNPSESMRVKLRGLEADGVYTVTNLDTAATSEVTGRELMEKGLAVVIKEQPGSAVITYEKHAGGAR
jgi:alpha-galactosidase